jgi:hypothetical protein
VVAAGLTDVVPPAAARVTLVPVPVTVTEVAFVAVTVKLDEPPAAIEAGLAEMVTVGAGVVPMELLTPHPVKSRGSTRPGIVQRGILLSDLRMRALVTAFSFLSP